MLSLPSGFHRSGFYPLCCTACSVRPSRPVSTVPAAASEHVNRADVLVCLAHTGAVPCPREGPAAMPPPAKKARTAGAEPAAAQPQAAPATAAAGITSRASAAPAACAPHALAAGLADKPPPAAVQVQHYALVHPSVLASLRPGPHTLEQLSSAIYSSMAGQQQLQQLRQPASVPLPSSCGGLAKGFAHGAACAEPAARAPGGSSSSAAARSRLNALLEGS